MKTLLFTALLFLSLAVQSQTIDCSADGAGIISIENLECNDDYITFVVTTTTNNSVSAYITGLPANSQDSQNDFDFEEYDDGDNFSLGNGFVRYFNVPSQDCEPLNLNLTTIDFDPDPEDICTNNVLINPFPAPIPTLGQWGLIILAFVLCIFGIVRIKKSLAVG